MKQFLTDLCTDIVGIVAHQPLASAILVLVGGIIGWIIGAV